jgi:hypothetical protein
MNGSLMRLVQHNHRILTQVFVQQSFSQQHTISHVLDDGPGRCVIFEPDRVTDFLAQSHSHLLTDSFCNTHGGDSSGLGASNLAFFGQTSFMQVLSDLGGLSASCLSNDNQDSVVHARSNQLLTIVENWKRLPLLLDG